MTALNLSGRPRARDLLLQLDREYWVWADSLPSPLRAAAHDRSTFDGSREPAEFAGPSSLNPGMTCTPWLFWERTSRLDDKTYLDISFAGALVVLSSMVMDHLTDGQARDPARSMLIARALEEKGRQDFMQLFREASDFWWDYQRLQTDHILSLAKELEYRRSPSALTTDAFRAMVSGKFAPVAVTAHAFAVSLDDPELGVWAERGLRELAIGSQLLDDMGDWSEDLKVGRFTNYIISTHEPSDWHARPWPGEIDVKIAIENTLHDVRTLNRTVDSFEEVLRITRGLNCSAWEEYVYGYLELAEQHREIAVAGYLKPVLEGELASG